MEHTESLILMRRHLGNWSSGPAVSMRSELLVAHKKLPAAGSVCCARVGCEKNFYKLLKPQHPSVYALYVCVCIYKTFLYSS
jgi:hypothetical protein